LTSRVEGPQVDPAGLAQLPPEQSGEDESGDDEEDVDADEATGDREVCVVEHHEKHREGSQPLDVWATRRSAVIDGRHGEQHDSCKE
jgi:hypothetical protein